MSTQFPKLEELRGRARSKLNELRGRVQAKRGQFMGSRAGTLRPQARVGGGALMQEARRRAERFTARIQERKPGILPMVKEFKPGERVKKILSPQNTYRPSIVSRGSLSVEAEESIPLRRDRLSVIM